jgi:hypothetical protein
MSEALIMCPGESSMTKGSSMSEALIMLPRGIFDDEGIVHE